MKRNKMSRRGQLLIATGLLINSCTIFIHNEYRSIPDFIVGMLMGSGLGTMIIALVRERRNGNSKCSLNRKQADEVA